MQRALEQFFSYWIPLVALIVIPLVIALGFSFVQPRVYQASANLWALRRYEVIGATGTESDLNSSPASTQTTAITELLQTRTFALTVARAANLSSTYGAAALSNPSDVETRMIDDLSKNVTVTAVGYNVLSITYSNRSPKIARSVVQAVVDQYGVSASRFSVIEATQLLPVYQEQLQQAQADFNQAKAAASNYLLDHPGAITQHDLQYSLLVNTAQTAQNAVTDAQSKVAFVQQEQATIGSGANSLFTVVDAPATASTPVSRTKTLLKGGGIGLGIGLLACIIFLVVAMRRDRSIYTVSDLERIIDAPVLMKLPHLPEPVLVQAVEVSGSKVSGANRRLLR